MKKKTKVIVIISAVTSVLIAFCAGFLISRATLDKDISDIDYILKMYKQYYYDEQDNVVGLFADSLLDQYSEFYTADEYKKAKEEDGGHHEGIGINFRNLTILFVSGNSPAFCAGIEEGDKIVAIKTDGGEYISVSTDEEFSAVFDTIPDNVSFTLKLDRKGSVYETALSRRAYQQTYVKFKDKTGVYAFTDSDGAMKMVRIADSDIQEDGVGYIDLDSFVGTEGGIKGVVGQFNAAMDKFKENNLHSLILDLRYNGGGFMHILQDISSYLLDVDDGSRVSISVARNKYGKEEIFSSSPAKYRTYGINKIAVLVNSGTASASEVLLGAMLDYNQNLAVYIDGARTYGKGIMQTTFVRPSGGGIKLTTARIFFPVSDISIHGVGVTEALNAIYPDKIFSSADPYSDALSFCK